MALAPEHLSLYELEAKPGTRFTHVFGRELTRQSEAMEGYFEHVVDTLTAAGYRWYETANFCCGLGGRAGISARTTTSATGTGATTSASGSGPYRPSATCVAATRRPSRATSPRSMLVGSRRASSSDSTLRRKPENG